jgi:hypothetical protein
MDTLANNIDTTASNMQDDLSKIYALTQSPEAEGAETFYSQILA